MGTIKSVARSRDVRMHAIWPAWHFTHWPGPTGGRDSPVVDRLMATLRENGMKPANPAAFAGPLDTTMDTSMSTTCGCGVDNHIVTMCGDQQDVVPLEKMWADQQDVVPLEKMWALSCVGGASILLLPNIPWWGSPCQKRSQRDSLPEEQQDLATVRYVVVMVGPGLAGLVQQPAMLAVLLGATADPGLDGWSCRGGTTEVSWEVTPWPAPWLAANTVGLDSRGGDASSLYWRGWVHAVPPLRLASHDTGREAGSPPPCPVYTTDNFSLGHWLLTATERSCDIVLCKWLWRHLWT